MENFRTGIVTKYIIDKNYGFIKDIETNKSYFFLLDKKEQITLKKAGYFPIAQIRYGDVLKFQIRNSQEADKKEEAYNLIFIENSYVSIIESDIMHGIPRFGIINKENENYYLTDKKITITFPLKIMHEENRNIDFDLLDNEPTLEYFLEQRKNPTKIYAKLNLQER